MGGLKGVDIKWASLQSSGTIKVYSPVVGYHHGYRSEQSLQVIWQFGSTCVAWVHSNKSCTGCDEFDLSTLKHESRHLMEMTQCLINKVQSDLSQWMAGRRQPNSKFLACEVFLLNVKSNSSIFT